MTDQISLVRSFTIEDVVVRSSTSERIVEAVCVPFDVPTRVRDFGGPTYLEAFDPKAFDRQLAREGAAGRVELRWSHQKSALDYLGTGVALTAERDHLRGQFRVFRGNVGDHVIDVLTDGAAPMGVSVGFRPSEGGTEERDGVVYRTDVTLREVSLTTEPAYDDAKVLAVRSHPDGGFYVIERDAPEAEPVPAPAPAEPVRVVTDPRTLRALERLGIRA